MKQKCEKCGHQVAWVGVWTSLALAVLKFFVGVASGSKACIADGLHSASCIITAFAIMLSQRIRKNRVGADFHYGYGKVEFIAAAFVSLLIICMAVALIAASLDHLMREPSRPPHLSAVLVALVSVGANEMMFRYMRCVGSQLKSQTVLANAWACRADCFSSIAVIVGVLGARLGLHHLDPIAALVVVALIVKVSAEILIDSVRALMDSSVNDAYGEEISALVAAVDGVRSISALRTRHVGQKIWVDLNVCVNPEGTIRDAQSVAARVKEALLEIGDLERITVECSPMESGRC